MSDPCTASIQAYQKYYNDNLGSLCGLDNYWKVDTRAEFCSKCLPQFDSLLSTYMTECSANIDPSLKLNHDGVKFYKTYYCEKDKATGKYCDQVVTGSLPAFNYKTPYSSWPAEHCSSSCVAAIDSAIRTYSSNAELMNNYLVDPSLFSGSSNPVSSCGSGGASIGSANGATGTGATGNGMSGTSNGTGNKTGFSFSTANSSNSKTSDATTLSAQVCLLSLIICLILALLK